MKYWKSRLSKELIEAGIPVHIIQRYLKIYPGKKCRTSFNAVPLLKLPKEEQKEIINALEYVPPRLVSRWAKVALGKSRGTGPSEKITF